MFKMNQREFFTNRYIFCKESNIESGFYGLRGVRFLQGDTVEQDLFE